METCWKDELIGSRSIIEDPITKKNKSNAIYHIKSLLWPGFHLFKTDNDYFSFYAGYGNKYKVTNHYPRFVFNIQQDAEDKVVQFESSKEVESKLENDEEEAKEEES